MELLGTRGRICITDSGNVIEHYEVVEGYPFAGYRGLVLKNRTEQGLRDVVLNAVDDVVKSLQSGKPPRCSAEDGIRALQIALAAQNSANNGRPCDHRDLP
jgi:predicted dehydrogenase